MFAFRRVSIIFAFFAYCSAEDVCVGDGDGVCGATTPENKYLEGERVRAHWDAGLRCAFVLFAGANNGRFGYYLEQIRKAKENYVPCNITNCQCFFPVIQNDLKTFKSGVTKKLLDNVKLKLVELFLFVNKIRLAFLFFCFSEAPSTR